jgi:O-6-methylguanine DNA methyltransferase
MTVLYSGEVHTPVGKMVAIGSDIGFCALEFDLPVRQNLLQARLAKWFAAAEIRPISESRMGPLNTWLGAYFAGRFPDAPPALDLRGTSFERKVWTALLAIPAGSTTTYGRLADDLGIPGCARAVGSAVRRNPMSLIVPCHRVVGSDGALRGYGGGLEQKRWLLQHERIR